MGRYDRQLPVFGGEGQRRIRSATFAVAGCGGLGCNVIKDLAMAGAGRLLLADCDSVSETDLNRQFLYAGRSGRKAPAAAEWARAANPDVSAVALDVRINENTATDLVSSADVVVDCLDNVGSRLALNAAALEAGVPLVHGGIDGLLGQATVVVPGETPCLRCILRGEGASASVSPVAALIASVESMEALRIASGAGPTLAGRLLAVDAGRGAFDVLRISRDPRCPACAKKY